MEQVRQVSPKDFLAHTGFVLASHTQSTTTPARNFLNLNAVNDVFVRRVEKAFENALLIHSAKRPARLMFWNGIGRDLRLAALILAHDRFTPAEAAHARLFCLLCGEDVRYGSRCALCGEGLCALCWDKFHTAHDLVAMTKPVRETMAGILTSEAAPRKKPKTGETGSGAGAPSSTTTATSVASSASSIGTTTSSSSQGMIPFPNLEEEVEED